MICVVLLVLFPQFTLNNASQAEKLYLGVYHDVPCRCISTLYVVGLNSRKYRTSQNISKILQQLPHDPVVLVPRPIYFLVAVN